MVWFWCGWCCGIWRPSEYALLLVFGVVWLVWLVVGLIVVSVVGVMMWWWNEKVELEDH